jgi:hypothetical protein
VDSSAADDCDWIAHIEITTKCRSVDSMLFGV